MKLNKSKNPQNSVILNGVIKHLNWNGRIIAAEWLGVLTEGAIEPRDYDVFSLEIAIPRTPTPKDGDDETQL